MIKARFILPVVAIFVVAIVVIYKSDAVEVADPIEVSVVVKEPTMMDTLVFAYDSIISSEIQKDKVVGAAIVISYKGELVYLNCFGVKEIGKTDSINPHTVFRLASVSKAVTGVLAGILSEENVIGLDDKVIDYLPGFRLKDSINTVDLSVRNILSHTSGLVPHAYDLLVEDHVPFRIIIDSLSRVNVHALPGELYGYQNVVFSLYDTISHAKTGKSFSKLLEEKVFDPFGMKDASAGYESFFSNPNIAEPHAGRAGNFRKLKRNDRYYITLPAAGINASISDMGQFLLNLTAVDSTQEQMHISKEVFKPQVKSPLRWNYLRKWDYVESKHYGLGWRIIGHKGHEIAYHGGYVSGYRAEIAVCREEGFGIAYLTNSPNSVGSDIVPLFLKLYFAQGND